MGHKHSDMGHTFRKYLACIWLSPCAAHKLRHGSGAAGVRAGRGEAAHTPARPGAALQNATGDHHCFLNALIQGLWHAHHFHRAILGVQVPTRLPAGSLLIVPAARLQEPGGMVAQDMHLRQMIGLLHAT